jgi:hypothetical protein
MRFRWAFPSREYRADADLLAAMGTLFAGGAKLPDDGKDAEVVR